MVSLNSLINKASSSSVSPTVAVAAACDKEVLKAVHLAVEKSLASFILFDNQDELTQLMELYFPDLLDNKHVSIQHSATKEEAARETVKAVASGEAHVVMKGNLPTSVILQAVLHKEYGLRTGRVLSHVAAFEVPNFEQLFFITDAAMNIEPDLKAKAEIIQNAVETARACGIEQPIVAPLAAVETINPAMEPTIDAAALVAMNKRGQIKNCIVDGPLALDNAISIEAAAQKGLTGNTAGKANILLVPNIEAGNILYKSLIYFAKAKVGAIIQGAKAPIVLTSRADRAESKVYSLALAILAAQNQTILRRNI
ncbi:phosphate butyryltransferase [Sporosarcina pasteurii]|uniref:Phosphate acetyltransferase n=1 Tax=Sporosarcina pasteurii TaxID=1474 RepID=A0A380BS53_SPOPA|nr:phosphate butyryltransferase [Sporosarcina pasteurii]MDS9471118.1 phosphate butyryltransferase [Sporosarcina pasteurii]QBQ05240.1 phosphate butyryltransferase [Sporosarcina pasteurii]SUJ04874.1 Phosphate acetyltransferase [Sporosarcina pasteurii]